MTYLLGDHNRQVCSAEVIHVHCCAVARQPFNS